MIHAEKEVCRFHQLPHSLLDTFRAPFYQHQCLQYIVVNPWIPVIDLLAAESHPPIIIPCEVRIYQVFIDFLYNSFIDERACFIEFVFQEIVGPCHLCADVGYYQFNGRFIPVGKSGAVFLKTEVCRVYPRGFAQKPHAVYDSIHKSSLSLYQFSDGKGLQGFVVGTSGTDFTGTFKSKVVGSEVGFPFVFQGLFSVFDDNLSDFRVHFLLPGLTVGILRIIHPALVVEDGGS